MRALCLILIKPNTSDTIINQIKRKHKLTKKILPVTGRADICVIYQGTMSEINKTVIELKKIKNIISTETLIEVEVNLGW